jgi:polysaccharide biosynthesis transport protein
MNLSQLALILIARKRIILLALLVTVGVSAVFTFFIVPKTYTATSSVVVNFKSSDPITGALPSEQILSDYIATQIDIITSQNVALKVIDLLKLAENPYYVELYKKSTKGGTTIRNWLTDIVLSQLEVKPPRESSVVKISYSDIDPQSAAKFANAFVQCYIQASLELKVDPAKNQLVWFEEQINSLRSAMEDARKKLSDYQQETGVLGVDERLDIENAKLISLSNQLVASQAQTLESVTRERYINAAAANSKLSESPEILGSSLIQSLKIDLARAEASLAEVSERVGRNHPQYLKAQAEVDSLRQKISTEIQAMRGSVTSASKQAQQREEELKKALLAQKEKVLELRQQYDKIAVLNREVESAQRALDTATQRADQIRLESHRVQTEIGVLYPAVPPLKPSKPNKILNLMLSSFLGTLLGVGFAFLTEMVDKRIRSEDDITQGVDLPILAVISNPRPLNTVFGLHIKS